MKIGINAIGNFSKDTGGRSYLSNFIHYLQRFDTKNEYVVFLSEKDKDIFEIVNVNIKTVSFKYSSYNSYLKVFYEQFILPFQIKKNRIDIMYYPGNYASLFCPAPFLLQVQSLLDVFKNKKLGFLKRIYRKNILGVSIKNAKQITTPSKIAKEEIIKHFKIDENKINVIYHGIDEYYYSDNLLESEKAEIFKRYKINGKYILYVSALWEHKNHINLILAYNEVVKKLNYNIKLVLIGEGLGVNKNYLYYLYNLPIKLGIKNNVVFTGNIEKKELKYFYKYAELLVFPSFCESFGMPLLEAMAVGIPIIASNSYALPEIAGNAGILIDPYNIKNIADSILDLLQNKELRNDKIKEGKNRIKEFSWENAVKKVLDILLTIK